MELDQVIRRDTLANRPAASAVPPGTLFYQSDKGVLQRSTGSAWEEFGWVPDAGTFTPELTFGGLNTGITYSARRGDYIAMGPWVLWRLMFALTSKGTAVGTNAVTGFPFSDPLGGVVNAVAGYVTGITSWGMARMNIDGTIALTTIGNTTIADTGFTNTSQFYAFGMFPRSAAVPW